MTKLDDLIEAVSEYSTRYRHPDLPTYSVGPAYDLFPEEENVAMECQLKWPDTWPNSDKAGVYAFLDRGLNVDTVRMDSRHA